MVENIDDNMGRLLDRLDALGLARRTIVVFLTDNGPNGRDRYNGGMRGAKGSIHEGGVRVPLFVRWLGRIRAGTTVTPIASHIDLFPTLVDLAGIPMPRTKPLDGVSLVPLLEGKTEGWPDRLIFSHQARRDPKVTMERGSVRSQEYRMAYERGRWQLYDMVADPGQKKDIARERPGVLGKLRSAYESWFRDVTKEGFDPLPFQLGHKKWPRVELPAHESHLHPEIGKGIRYADGPGYAHDWITDWTSTEAYPRWDVQVLRPGRYDVSLLYTCPEPEIGSRIRVEIGDRSVEGRLSRAYEPTPILRKERAATRKRYTKSWATLELGSVELAEGRMPVTVRIAKLQGKTPMDLKAVRLTWSP